MITPLTQRQIFQTAHVEALRMSLEMSEQIQREASRRKTLEDHMAEEADEVHEIGKTDALRTEERKERPQGRDAGGAMEGGGEEASGAEPRPESSEARLDFLA